MKSIFYQGVPGSFSHIAAMEYFGAENEFVGTKQFIEIFRDVESNVSSFGVVPVENTLAGSIYENYDNLYEHNVYAVGEINIKVEHFLLALPDVDESSELISIKKVYSHIKAIEQCERFFETHPWMEKTVHSDTAGAAKMVAESGNKTIAAIASNKAAELYGLKKVRSNIEDDGNNFTRFVIISKNETDISEANKCSLIITLPHTPGSLYAALSKLAEHGVNLTKIESRPILGKPFEYVFYIDIEFPGIDKNTMSAVINGGFKEHTSSVKILGFYKSAKKQNANT